MMGIVDDIFSGVTTMQDIVAHNIEVVEQTIVKEENNKHAAENCGRPYCHHGNPRYIKQLKDHLEFLKSELEDNPQ